MAQIDEVLGRLYFQRKRAQETVEIRPFNGNVLVAADHRSDRLAQQLLELIDTMDQLALIVKSLKA